MSRLDELIAEFCPDGVKYFRLKDVCKEIIVPMRDRPKDLKGPIPWCRIEDKEGQYFNGSLSGLGVTEETVKKMNLKVFPTGTVICSCSASIGAYAINTQPLITNQTFIGLVSGEKLYNMFLLFFMETQTAFLLSQASTGTIPYISRKKFEEMLIPVPPLPVQLEIVRILNHFRELIVELAAELTAELTARKKQYEYYRDKLLTSLDNSAPVYSMGDVLTFINGRAFKQQELLDDGKYPVLRVGNFYTNNSWYYSDLELSEDKYCDNGDLLYSWAATLGPKIWNGGKCIFHYHIWKIIFDETLIDKVYLYYYLQYDLSEIAKSTTQSTMVHVSMESMKKRKISIPPIDDQRRLAALIKEFDSLQSSVSNGIPAEIDARQKQYEYYRDKLLTFKEISL